MPGKKKGSPYRRVQAQKASLAPVRSPGNHPVPADLDDVTPKIDRLIVPGQQPVTERVVERRIRQERFDGPLPHPEIFRQYGQVIRNAPERILTVFEQDSEHIRFMQRSVLMAQKEDNRRVQWMAFSLIAGGYIMAAIFALMDRNALAGIVLTTTIIGTVVGFLQNRHQNASSASPEEGADDKKKVQGKKDDAEAKQLEDAESDS